MTPRQRAQALADARRAPVWLVTDRQGQQFVCPSLGDSTCPVTIEKILPVAIYRSELRPILSGSPDADSEPRYVVCDGNRFQIVDGRRVWLSTPPPHIQRDLL